MFVRIHIVQKGETLWRIAKQYGIGLDELKRLNAHLANPDYIVPGMEIVLPENSGAASKSTMTKAQQTAPMPSKEVQTAPMPAKEIQTAPKEQATKPVKEVPKVVETAPIPAPVPQPMPAPVPMPQFQFDFAPQMHFEQPQPLPAPAPQPMPEPQPIYIQVPVQQPKVETNVETTIEKEVEYVQVPLPQPQIIYVCCPPPQPCGCKEQVYHHNPCGCHEQQFQQFYHNPCGCHEQQLHHQSQPCGCHEQQFHHQSQPCGCQEQGFYQPMQFEHDFQQMPQQDYDCGCGGGGYPSGEMMPYGMPYFEPNYDMAPQTDVSPAMMGVPDEDHDGLPDWLLDSSELQANMVDQEFDGEAVPQDFEEFNPFDPDHGQAANYYQDGYNYGNGAYPYAQNYMYQGMPQQMMQQQQMPQMMPQQMMQQQQMPQQMMQPNCQGYPNNPYLQHNKPWNY